MHAFCHLRPERSFSYAGGLQSLLCHRCSAIYSSFLLALLAAWAMRWNGRWSRTGQPLAEVVVAAGLVLLSLVQVEAEDLFGDFVLTEAPARFFVGGLTGFGLLQLNRIFQQAEGTSRPRSLLLALPVLLLIPHYVAARHSWWYSSSTTAAGVLAIYFAMNSAVLRSFFPAATRLRLAPWTLLLMALEWTGIYFYNR